jgi:hypothetical protein
MLFVNEEGFPITEYLPDGHEALESYGVIKDSHPEKGRPLRQKENKSESTGLLSRILGRQPGSVFFGIIKHRRYIKSPVFNFRDIACRRVK